MLMEILWSKLIKIMSEDLMHLANLYADHFDEIHWIFGHGQGMYIQVDSK